MLWRDDQPEPLRPPHQAQPLEQVPQQDGLQGTPLSDKTIRPMSLRIDLARGNNNASGSKAMSRSARRSGSLDGMVSTVRYGTTPLKKISKASVPYRLHERHGEAPNTWDNRMHGAASDYNQVARMNRMLRDLGLTDRLCELMAVVDASMAPAVPTSLTLALHEAEMADTAEQVADESFRHALANGTATTAGARDAIRKSAVARGKAEIAEAGMLRWIEQQAKGAEK